MGVGEWEGLRAWLLMSLERYGGSMWPLNLTDWSFRVKWVGESEDLLLLALVRWHLWQDWGSSPSYLLPAALWGSDIGVR